jgi:magnesium transporter
MIIDCAHYQQGRRRDAGPVPLEEAAARCNQGGFVWLGLFEPEEGELAQVRDTFGLLDLAIEDALKIHRRPKIENYDHGVQLVILRTARYDDDDEEVEFGEISVLLAPTFVITVRQGAGGELRGARQRLEQQPELLAEGSVAALWAILDAVIDGYKPVVTEVGYDIDQIEATVFAGASAPTERIYSLRREATGFYRAVHPLLGVTGSIEREVSKKLRHFLRAVHDSLLLIDEEVAAQRSARHHPGGQHGGALGRAELHHRAAHHPGHGHLAADVRDRLLRPELQLADRPHLRRRCIRRLRDRRPRGAADRAVLVAQAPCTLRQVPPPGHWRSSWPTPADG